MSRKITREEFEDMYREAWLADIRKSQHKKDLEAKERMKIDPHSLHPAKLSEKAQVLNRLLLRGMTDVEAAEILGRSKQAIRDMKDRYNLPIR